MKFITYSKRFLSLLLILAMLILACACGDSSNNETEKPTDTEETEATEATKAPLADTDIQISGDKPYRIVYSEGNRSYALKVQDKIIGLDKSYTVGSGKYELVEDTAKAEDGTPEIVIGKTNRPISAEAKALVTKEDTYVIFVTSNAISVYSETPAGVEAGVKELVTKFKRKSDIVIYNNAPGLKAFRERYNVKAILARFRKHGGEGHVRDDEAKWDRVPTKIRMDEVLSVDVQVKSPYTPDKAEKGDKNE
jgi:hypothetical protein